MFYDWLAMQKHPSEKVAFERLEVMTETKELRRLNTSSESTPHTAQAASIFEMIDKEDDLEMLYNN